MTTLLNLIFKGYISGDLRYREYDGAYVDCAAKTIVWTFIMLSANTNAFQGYIV